MTDGAGHGVLVATDKIYMLTASLAATGAQEAIVKILYRLVDVGLEEYIGIVQSQQA